MPIGALKEAKKNPKKHLDGDIGQSIGRFGYVDPIVLDERTQRLVAGHGRLHSLRKRLEAGEDPPQGVKVKGKEWLVPVLRGWASTSDTEAEAYLLASNQLTMGGGWDNGPLAEMLKGLAEQEALEGVGFDDAMLSKLLDSMEDDKTEEEDEPPPASAEPWVKSGELFDLGGHRILCGDSTKAEDVDRVMGGERAHIVVTDPPWNLAYDAEVSRGRKSKRREIANDNLDEAFPQFCALFAAEMKRIMFAGAPLYLVMNPNELGTIDRVLKELGFHWSSTIVWVKDQFNVGAKDYHTQYEPIWYGWKEGAGRLVELEDRTQSDLWEIPRPKKSDEHPTMKPVELVARSLMNSSRRGDVCFEPFSGSGTTLMACEHTGRQARAIELEPRYVQVAIERWERQTGMKARKL